MVDFRVHKDVPDSFCPPYSTYLMSTIRGAIVLLAINVCNMPGRQKTRFALVARVAQSETLSFIWICLIFLHSFVT